MVDTCDVRSVLSGLDRPPRLVKLDVEGAELLLLEAMAEVVDPGATSLVVEVIPPVTLPGLFE